VRTMSGITLGNRIATKLKKVISIIVSFFITSTNSSLLNKIYKRIN